MQLAPQHCTGHLFPIAMRHLTAPPTAAALPSCRTHANSNVCFINSINREQRLKPFATAKQQLLHQTSSPSVAQSATHLCNKPALVHNKKLSIDFPKRYMLLALTAFLATWASPCPAALSQPGSAAASQASPEPAAEPAAAKADEYALEEYMDSNSAFKLKRPVAWKQVRVLLIQQTSMRCGL